LNKDATLDAFNMVRYKNYYSHYRSNIS